MVGPFCVLLDSFFYFFFIPTGEEVVHFEKHFEKIIHTHTHVFLRYRSVFRYRNANFSTSLLGFVE